MADAVLGVMEMVPLRFLAMAESGGFHSPVSAWAGGRAGLTVWEVNR